MLTTTHPVSDGAGYFCVWVQTENLRTVTGDDSVGAFFIRMADRHVVPAP